MNRIYLDKLFEYTYSTYLNCYSQMNKKIDLGNEIIKIKQNMSLNEQGTFIKYNYVELSTLIPSIEYDECVLVCPISFNIEDNPEWYNFLNCLLLILNEDYLKESNITKKKILQIADKMYKKHLKIDNKLNYQIYEKVSEMTGLNFIILSNDENNLKVTKYKKTSMDKWLICYKFNNNYFPVWNFEKKYFTSSSYFIKYLNDIMTKITVDSDKNELLNKNEKDKDQQNIKEIEEIEETEDAPMKSNDAYEEFVTNENYALYLSEAVDNKKQKIKKNKDILNTTDKKKNKNKNIFVSMEQNVETHNKKDVTTDNVFKKTEIIDVAKIRAIISNIKTNTKLEQIQSFALELGLTISCGSTKDGKPKNKTKNELIDEIKQLEKNI